MKRFNIMAGLLLCLLSASAATAAGKKGESKLKTSFKFDGTTLRGKFQSSLGTTATVENDKYLDDLLGGRKSFEDRIQKENRRN